MANLLTVIVPAKKLIDGRHKVRIAVSHNSQTRYIVTDVIVDSEREFKNGQVVKRPDSSNLNRKLRKILTGYQEKLDNMESFAHLSCAELVDLLKNKKANTRHLILKDIFNEYLSTLVLAENSLTTYKTGWGRLSQFLDENSPIEHINFQKVSLLKTKLVKKYSPSTVKLDLALLSSTFLYARKCGYTKPDFNPMLGLKLPETYPRDSWLTVEEMRMLRDVELKDKEVRVARDIIMLSYYLGGINIVDLVKINFNDHPDTLRYIRTKTQNRVKLNKYVEFKIPEEAKPIILQYKDKNGFILKHLKTPNVSIHYYILKLREITGLSKLVYYSARKSFSQHAFNLGISTPVIDYILGHKVEKSGSSIFSYIVVTPSMATEALRKILDNLKNNVIL